MTNQLFKDDEDRIGWIDIGSNHFIKFTEYKDDPKTAIRIKHLSPSGEPCQGFAPFKGGAWAKQFEFSPTFQSWDVASLDPLTISPSLLCVSCKDHGFIREGRWVCA